MKDSSDSQRAKARAMMPEVAKIVKPTQPAMGPRAVVTAPGTMRNYKNGGGVHSDVKQDKAMVKSMVKPSALKANGGAARAMAKPGTSTGTTVERMKSGGKCMADGGVSGLGHGKAAGAPTPAPRAKSAGMKPASIGKYAAGGVAKQRRGVATPVGKPAPLPKGGKIPVNMGPRSKAGR